MVSTEISGQSCRKSDCRDGETIYTALEQHAITQTSAKVDAKPTNSTSNSFFSFRIYILRCGHTPQILILIVFVVGVSTSRHPPIIRQQQTLNAPHRGLRCFQLLRREHVILTTDDYYHRQLLYIDGIVLPLSFRALNLYSYNVLTLRNEPNKKKMSPVDTFLKSVVVKHAGTS